MSSMLNKLTGNSSHNDTTTTSGASTTGTTGRAGLGDESRIGSGLTSGSSTGYGSGATTTTGSHSGNIAEEAREWATAHMEHDARVAFTGKSTTANVMSQNQATNVEIPAQTMTATLPAKRVVVEVPERQVEVQLPARQLQLENQPEIEVRTHPTIRSVAHSAVSKVEGAFGHHDNTASATSGSGLTGSSASRTGTNNY